MTLSPENKALISRVARIDGDQMSWWPSTETINSLLDAAREEGAAAECKRIEDMVNNRPSSDVVSARVGDAGFTCRSPGNERGPSGRVTEIKS